MSKRFCITCGRMTVFIYTKEEDLGNHSYCRECGGWRATSKPVSPSQMAYFLKTSKPVPEPIVVTKPPAPSCIGIKPATMNKHRIRVEKDKKNQEQMRRKSERSRISKPVRKKLKAIRLKLKWEKWQIRQLAHRVTNEINMAQAILQQARQKK